MTSSINPNNIDGAYPVAGQDNNSQGFRDNFTNTKTNFQYAADEISDLQSKVVLKQALTGSTLNNDMLGSILSNAQLQDMSQTRVALGSVSGSVTINYAAGSVQTLTTNGSVSLGFSNWPAAGAAGVVAVQITLAAAAHTVTFPPAVSVNTEGILGLDHTTNVMAFAWPGVYTFQFSSSDGGTTVSIFQTNNILTPLNHSGAAVTNGLLITTPETTHTFSTTGAWTSTLSDGVEGQTKIFAMLADGGDMVMTVTNAGWNSGASGTATFNAVGDACTMRFIQGSWFCVGNNGVTFG